MLKRIKRFYKNTKYDIWLALALILIATSGNTVDIVADWITSLGAML